MYYLAALILFTKQKYFKKTFVKYNKQNDFIDLSNISNQCLTD